MAATTNNNNLVPAETLDELKALDGQLAATNRNLEALLAPLGEIAAGLSHTAAGYKELNEQVGQLDEAESGIRAAYREQAEVRTQIDQLQDRLAQSDSRQAAQAAALSDTLRQQSSGTDASAAQMQAAEAAARKLESQLESLTRQYNTLSNAAQKAAGGLDLQRQITQLSGQIKLVGSLNQMVKASGQAATQSASAWKKFVQGTLSLADVPQPKVKQTHTAADRAKTLASIGQASRLAAKSERQVEIDKNAAIAADQSQSFRKRIKALDTHSKLQKESVRADEKAQIDTLVTANAARQNLNAADARTRIKLEEELATEIAAIRAKAADEMLKIDGSTAEGSASIGVDKENDSLRKTMREVGSKGKKLGREESREKKSLVKEYARGDIDTEEYEKRKLEITQDYAGQRFTVEQELMRQQLDQMDLTAEQRAQIEQKMAESHAAYLQKVGQAEGEANKETAEKDKKRQETQQANTAKQIEFAKQMYDDLAKVVSGIMKADTDAKLKKIEKEEKENEKYFDSQRDQIEDLEESGAISKEQADARKAALDEQEAQRAEELDQKKKEIQITQAKREKAMSVMSIMVNTAAAILGIWAQVPKFDFGISATAMTIMVSALGAVQLAAALATPIPEYALGTRNHPGGLAIVGDGGRSELVMTPGGGIFATPSTGTLVDLPAHSMVLPDLHDAMENLDPLPALGGTPGDRPVVVVDTERLADLQHLNNKLMHELVTGNRADRANRMYYYQLSRVKPPKTWN